MKQWASWLHESRIDSANIRFVKGRKSKWNYHLISCGIITDCSVLSGIISVNISASLEKKFKISKFESIILNELPWMANSLHCLLVWEYMWNSFVWKHTEPTTITCCNSGNDGQWNWFLKIMYLCISKTSYTISGMFPNSFLPLFLGHTMKCLQELWKISGCFALKFLSPFPRLPLEDAIDKCIISLMWHHHSSPPLGSDKPHPTISFKSL